MIRHALRATFLLLLIGVAMDHAGYGQPVVNSPDKIVYRDRKADGAVKTTTGELKETSGGNFQVISNGKPVSDGKSTLELTAADIIRVVPASDMPGLARDRLLDLDGRETGKDYAKAKPDYEALLRTGLRQPTKRYVETRLNLLRARLLEEADDQTRAADGPPLAKDLKDYLLAYPKGWEIWPIGRALARLQADEGRYGEVAQTWGQLAKNDGLAKELRDEAAMKELDAIIRDGKFPAAASRAADVARSGVSSEGFKDRLAIYQAASKGGSTDPTAAIKEIEAVIARTKDPLARAAGYSMIGELNLAANKLRDAMWAYLWVEVVFNQDRDEVMNAMSRLVKIFDGLGDKDRVDSYKDRIRKFRNSA